jgi:uncharacterized protein (TIGR00369 family)
MTDATRSQREPPLVPLHELLGVPIDPLAGRSADGNKFRLELPLTEQLRGTAQAVHGGVLASMIDIACGIVAFTPELWERGAVPVTTELHVRYFRQPGKGPLVVEAHARHKGKRLISVECTVTDGDGKELTCATATYMVVEGAGLSS